jgi:GxxExxY protein
MKTINQISGEIVDAAYHIHTRFGPGLFESVYETLMAHELKKKGLNAEQQVEVPFEYDGLQFSSAFRADLIVENVIIVELKSVECLNPIHSKQLLTYLKLADKRLGLLINFGAVRIKDGIIRLANNLPE